MIGRASSSQSTFGHLPTRVGPFGNCRSRVTHATSHGFSSSTTTIYLIAAHRYPPSPPIASTNHHPACPQPAPTSQRPEVATPASLRPYPRHSARGRIRAPARRRQSVRSPTWTTTTKPRERKPRGDEMGRKAGRKRKAKAGSRRKPGERKPIISTPSAHHFPRKTSAMKADEDAAARATAATTK